MPGANTFSIPTVTAQGGQRQSTATVHLERAKQRRTFDLKLQSPVTKIIMEEDGSEECNDDYCTPSVGHCRRATEMRLGEGALVEEGDVGVPPTSLLDDALGVRAQQGAQVCGAASCAASGSKRLSQGGLPTTLRSMLVRSSGCLPPAAAS